MEGRPDIEELIIFDVSLTKDLTFFEKGFENLRIVNITGLQVDDLSPLIKLQSLEELNCYVYIPDDTSLVPLARCLKLKLMEFFTMRWILTSWSR